MRKFSGAIERTNIKGICDYPTCQNIFRDGRRKFCSDACGSLFFFENNWTGLRFVAWLTDGGRCRECGIHLTIKYNGTNYALKELEHFHKIDTYDWWRKIFDKYHKGELFVHQSPPRNFGLGTWEDPDFCGGKCYETPINRKVEVDHIVAITNGGKHLALKNLRALCHDCHSRKTGYDFRLMHKNQRIEEGIIEIEDLQKGLDDYF